ncbi:MAG: GNAT family N-acetyltransferase [Mediterranea sp.]|jgi:RimJ/RimL family protein N-acetyltransferase|nr:GNAT family N-acetyltransferase [Mediterranea sp.]
MAIVRKANLRDIEIIMNIIDNARALMRITGNKKQWISGYPSLKLITEDVLNETCYVCVDEDDIILATFFFKIITDGIYPEICKGKWLCEGMYGIVHRIASAGIMKHVSDICLNWCFEQCSNICIDTHEDNKIMQHVLMRNKFIYCGITYTDSGSPRLAFQKCRIEKSI